jgi:Trm5-related predicted tRNA methylase
LIFYYNAAYTRILLREEQTKLKIKRAEANAYVQIKNEAIASGNKITTDEINSRVALNPVVQQYQDEEVELKAKRSIIKGIIDSVERKGFSLQLVGSIRMREEDWLRRSFSDRFKDDPRRKQVAGALNQVLGANYVS